MDFENVKFILDLKILLILVGKLDDEGHHVTFGDHQWKVTKGNLVVATSQMRGTL